MRNCVRHERRHRIRNRGWHENHGHGSSGHRIRRGKNMTDRPNIDDLLLLWEDSLARQGDVAGGNLPELPGPARRKSDGGFRPLRQCSGWRSRAAMTRNLLSNSSLIPNICGG